MNSARVKIIVLNWNKPQLTIECLHSISKITYENYSTLIVDNGSNDNSIKLFHDSFPDVEVLSLDKNYKYAGGYNLAFNHLATEDIDYFMLLNNDTIVSHDIVSNFVKNINKYPHSIFGPKIYYLNKDVKKIWYAGSILNLKKGNIYHRGIGEIDLGQYDRNIETGYITGCCMFAHKNIFLSLKGFDLIFNMYGEDVDFCMRANNLNIKSYYIYDSIVWHHVSASINVRMKFFVMLMSTFKLIIKHLPFMCWPMSIIKFILISFYRKFFKTIMN